MIDIEKFLKQKKIDYREAPDDELNVKTCPFCGDDSWGFYINKKTGLFYCHEADCEVKGTWYTFLRQIGELYPIRKVVADEDEIDERRKELFKKEEDVLMEAHRDVWKQNKAIEFLKLKKITPQCVRDFRIGIKKDDRGLWWMSFPYYSDGELANCKYRTVDGMKRFKRLTGGKSVLYNEDFLMGRASEAVILAEGETDTLATYSQGIDWVVGVPAGAKAIKDEWVEQLDKFEKVYICFDTDIAGQKGAHTFAKRLGYERCRNVVLPIGCKDLCEFFQQENTKSDLLKLLRKARPFEVEGIVPLRDAVRRVAEEFKLRGTIDTGIHLPWGDVDKCMGGLLGGDLVVISGIPGVGKTSFALNVAHNWTLHEGIPTLFFCQEMRPERLALKLMALHLEKDSKFLTEEDIMKCHAEFRDYPLYFVHAYRGMDIEKVKNTLRESVRRYGIGFMVFDHLHFLCRDVQNMTNQIGVVVREFKNLAEDEGIPIFLIVHPRKRGLGKDAVIPTQDDLRDSGLIPADADFIIIIHRNRREDDEGVMEKRFESKALIRVEKARFDAGGDSWINFEGEKSLFVDY